MVCECSVGTGLHIAQVQKADLHALQLFNQMVEMLKHDTNLVLPAFNQADFVPGVVAFANEFQTGWCGLAAVHGDAGAKEFFFFVSQRALDFGQVSFGDVAGRRGESIGEIAVVGEKEEALAEVIQPADRVDTFAHTFEELHHCFAAFGIKDGGDDVLRFVERVVRKMFGHAKDVAVYFHLIRGEVCFRTKFGDGLAVDRDVAGDDEFFGLAAAGDSGVGEDFLEAFFRHLGDCFR